MTTPTQAPNWRQFSRIPWSVHMAEVARILALEIPPEGRPTSFRYGTFYAHHADGIYLIRAGSSTRYVNTPEDVRAAARLSKGTPGGDALRQWLEMWQADSITPPVSGLTS